MSDDPDSISPRVSIGLPVFNGERLVRRALDSLLTQTYQNFELIISDNNSSDATFQICSFYAARDARIRLIKQPVNIGASRNFGCVLSASSCEYFMWAAHDDIWSATFIEKCVSFLDQSHHFIGVQLPVKVFGQPEQLAGDDAWGCEECSVLNKSRHYLPTLNFNSRFYGLFRKDVIVKFNIENYDFFAGDWAWILEVARMGCIAKLDGDTGMWREPSGSGSLLTLAGGRSTPVVKLLFPFSRAAGAMLRSQGCRYFARNLAWLLYINIKFSAAMLLELLRTWRK